MHAVMLAAGRGSRLAGALGGDPKCLLRFGGHTLLDRHVRLLEAAGVEQLTLVTGFAQARIEDALTRLPTPLPVTTVYNPDYALGSVVSLWAARAALTGGEDVLLMDADVLYDGRMLGALMGTDHDNCFLFDGDYVPGDEPVKLCLRGDRLVEFRKRLAPDLTFDASGESVGFFRLAPAMARRLADTTAAYRRRGGDDAPHEEALRDLLLAEPNAFGYADVSGVPWIEIDFPEDIERARREILPVLQPLPERAEP